jgi:hypothetical protein
MKTEFLGERLRRLHEGGAWHGPSLRELIEGVSEAEGGRKVGPHTIAQLVGKSIFGTGSC